MDAQESKDRQAAESLRGEVHKSHSGFLNGVLILAGCACLGLGVMGVILPILPTTPFLLLAAICFAHSSERFYVWLLTNRFFGQYIRDWRENRGLTVATKLWVIFVLVATIALSAFYFVPFVPVQAGLIAIGLGVSAYIWRLPVKVEDLVDEETD